MRPIPPTRASDEDIKRITAHTMAEVRKELYWRLSDIIACASEPTPRPWAIISMVEGCERAIASLSSLKEDGE